MNSKQKQGITKQKTIMNITIKFSAIVLPSQETPNHRLWLSNLDTFHRGSVHVPTVYLYEKNPNGSPSFFDTELLLQALAKVLVPFYPAAGRLAMDENGRIEIDCNGEGVLFVKAKTDSALCDVGDFMPGSQLMQFVPKVNYSGDMSSYPLVVLQVTKLSCGGALVGVGWHHTLGDGEAANHFINSWSNIARGISIPISPFLQRTLLKARDPPIPSFHHIEYDPLPTITNNNGDPPQVLQPIQYSTSILEIPLEQINALKATVNKSGGGAVYSTFEILAAHIWRCSSESRGLRNGQETKLLIPVDGRSRMIPPLPPGYFGNVICRAATVVSAGEMLCETLEKMVERIHEAIRRMDDEYLRSVIDVMENTSRVEGFVGNRSTSIYPNLVIISWIRLPFAEADFGWGPPAWIRPAKMIEGQAFILPSFGNDGNLSLAICLMEDHLKSFKKVFYGFN